MQKEILNEQGRSMVEMLGVLAIIGVLSVMGIAGYKAAMTRHRANELLNEATKRAVVVAGQITLHGHSPSLSEFNEKDFSGGSFELTVYGASGTATWQNAETDKQFTLSITGVEGNICEQMKSVAADNAVIQTFAPTTCDTGNDNNVKLTYNNDLSTDTIPSGDDTPAAEPCPTERQCGDVCCGEGNVCVDENKCCFRDYEGDEGMCCNIPSTGYTTIGECCPENTTPFITYSEDNGNYIETQCCPMNTLGVDWTGECCGADMSLVKDWFAHNHCCPQGTQGWSTHSNECCEIGLIAVHGGEGHTFCCPKGSSGFDSRSQECCLTGTVAVPEAWQSFHCCPEGSTGYDKELGKCCTEAAVKDDGENEDIHCCPSGSTAYVNGECI